jgi:spore coat polysaccharide biosynthesis protein SpsF (cytidylyltransferase family)
MNCPIFVLVRTESKRLRRKALKKIQQKYLIQILLERLNKIGNELIVCTTNLASDNKLVNFLESNNYEVFRGDGSNILLRLYSCAEFFQKKEFLVVEADDIFCDSKLIDITCKKIKEKQNELIIWEDVPFGSSPTGVKLNKLEKIINKNKNHDVETGWISFLINSEKFNILKLKPREKSLHRPEIRLSIDYKEDLILAEKILKSIPDKISLKNIIHLLDKNPNWLKNNKDVMNKYKENFLEETTKIRKEKKSHK